MTVECDAIIFVSQSVVHPFHLSRADIFTMQRYKLSDPTPKVLQREFCYFLESERHLLYSLCLSQREREHAIVSYAVPLEMQTKDN